MSIDATTTPSSTTNTTTMAMIQAVISFCVTSVTLVVIIISSTMWLRGYIMPTSNQYECGPRAWQDYSQTRHAYNSNKNKEPEDDAAAADGDDDYSYNTIGYHLSMASEVGFDSFMLWSKEDDDDDDEEEDLCPNHTTTIEIVGSLKDQIDHDHDDNNEGLNEPNTSCPPTPGRKLTGSWDNFMEESSASSSSPQVSSTSL